MGDIIEEEGNPSTVKSTQRKSLVVVDKVSNA